MRFSRLGRVPVIRIDRTGAAVVGAILMVTFGGLGFEQAIARHRLPNARAAVRDDGADRAPADGDASSGHGRTADRRPRRATRARSCVAITAASGVLSAALRQRHGLPDVHAHRARNGRAARTWRRCLYCWRWRPDRTSAASRRLRATRRTCSSAACRGIGYTRFASELAPVALVGLGLGSPASSACCSAVISLGRRPHPMSARIRPLHRRLMVKPLVVATAMLVGFFAGIDPALVAAGGAAALLVTRRVKPEKVWRRHRLGSADAVCRPVRRDRRRRGRAHRSVDLRPPARHRRRDDLGTLDRRDGALESSSATCRR